jgi:Domain of unknown function (DUF4396)
MLDGVLLLWAVLTLGAVVFVVWDQATRTPVVGVMKPAWVLVVLYTGPIGLFIYLLACREPIRGTHDEFIAARWKQAVGSLIHCLAGDATGIIVSAAIVYHFGLPNGTDLVIEYLSAFAVGLFVFQAMFMKCMFGGYWPAVRKTFFAETVSMNMVMFGMIPAMAIMMHLVPGGADPWRPEFWGIMSAAATLGGATAYPINSWLVRKGFKHGMMTARAEASSGGMMAGGAGHGGMRHAGAPPEPSWPAVFGVSLGTFAAMLAAVAAASFFVPIRF